MKTNFTSGLLSLLLRWFQSPRNPKYLGLYVINTPTNKQLLGKSELTSKPIIVKLFEISEILRCLQIFIGMVVMSVPCTIIERFLHRLVIKAGILMIDSDLSTLQSVVFFWLNLCNCFWGKRNCSLVWLIRSIWFSITRGHAGSGDK